MDQDDLVVYLGLDNLTWKIVLCNPPKIKSTVKSVIREIEAQTRIRRRYLTMSSGGFNEDNTRSRIRFAVCEDWHCFANILRQCLLPIPPSFSFSCSIK